MKKFYLATLATLFIGLTSIAQNVTVNVDVIELTHNWDCGNDGIGFNNPEPRWRVWGGHSGGNFNQACTSCCSNLTINGGTRACGDWNVGDFDLLNVTNQNISQVNVDLQSWEEDGCHGDCDPNTCGIFDNGGNDDDCRAGRERVANIDFRNQAPCQYNQYGFFYRDCGYGVKIDIYWQYSTLDGGTISSVPAICPGGNPAIINSASSGTTAWTNYTWEQQVGCTGAWVTIAGATGASYDPPTLTETTCFRRVVNTCNGVVGYSNTVTVTVHPTPTPTATNNSPVICSNVSTDIDLTSDVGGTTFTYSSTASPGISGHGSGTGNSIDQTLVNTGTADGTVTYTINTSANGCPGNSTTATVTVHPIPTVNVSPSISTVCSGETTSVGLTGPVAGTTFAWTASSSDAQVGGYSDSNGSTISQTLTNTGTVQGAVTYTITPSANGCDGTQSTATVNVDPLPQGNISAPAAICDGSGDNITFNFTVGTSPYDVQYSDGTNTFVLNDINSGHTVAISPTSTTTYSLVSIIDDAGNGCTRTSGFGGDATVTVNPLPVGTVSGSTTICEGDATDLTFNFTVGAGPFDVIYSDGSGTSTLTGISDGHTLSISPSTTTTYTITQITDANGCVGTTGFGTAATITVNEMPDGTMSVLTPICQGDQTTLTFNFTAGTGPYNISYTDGIQTYTENGISSGATATHIPPTTVTYAYTSIEDANGCFRTIGFAGDAQVTVNPLPIVSFSGLASDYCEVDAAVTITGNNAPGGTFTGPGITDGGDGTATFDPAGAGIGSHTVTYTYTDINGCTNSVDQAVNVDQEPTAVAGPAADECTLEHTFAAVPSIGTGTWSMVAGPGSAFFSNANSPTATVQVTAYGTYDFQWEEVNGQCDDASLVTINFYETPVVDLGADRDECQTTFTLDHTSSIPVSSYQWSLISGPMIAAIATPAAGMTDVTTDGSLGDYAFELIVEVNGCSDRDTIVITQVAQPVANAGTGGNECDLNFDLNATPSVGTGVWTQTLGPGFPSFSPNANDPNATVTVSEYGFYEFTWTETNIDCSDDASITVNFFEQPVANPGTGGNECDLDFVFSAIPSAGNGMWTQVGGPGNSAFNDATDPGTTVTVDQLGAYTYQWEEVNGTCSDVATITVNYFEQPVADAGLDGEECDLDVQLGAIPSVGNGLWTYSGPGTATFAPDATDPNAVATVTDYGVYIFTWTEDNFGCTDAASVTVDFDEQTAANAGSGGDECDLDFTFNATLSVGTGLWTSSGPGNAFFSSATDPNASVTVDAYGSYEFTWTETNGSCSASDMVTVNFWQQPLADPGLVEDQCDLDFTFSATPSAGIGTWTYNGPGNATFTPNDNDPNATVEVDAYGNYNFIWTENNNGCLSASLVNMNFHEPATVSFSGLDGPYCVDQTDPVTLTGLPAGGTFSGLGVSGNEFVPSVAGVGTIFITYTYTDINGCVSEETQSVDVNGLPTVSFSGLDAEYCEDVDGPIALTGLPAGGAFSGPGVFGNDFIPSSLAAGTYTVTYSYSDVFGCENTTSQDVTINALPVVEITGLDAEYCFDGPLTSLTGTPAGGTWSGPGMVGSDFSPPIAGEGVHDISYTYTDANGCTDTAVETVEVHALPVAEITPSGTFEICEGDVFPLDAGPGFATYDWDGAGMDQTLDVSTAGDYIVTVTNAAGCIATSDATTIIVNPLPTVELGNDTTICMGGDVTLDAGNPGATYNWSTFEMTQTINVSATDNYSVIVTDGNGCMNTDDITVQVQGDIEPIIVAVGPDAVCSGESVTLDAGDGYSTYLWSTNEGSQTISVSQSGIYEVIVEDQFGCSGTAEPFLVTIYPLPNAVIIPDGPTNLCEGDSVTLCASNTFADYSWSPNGETGNCITVDESGTYNVTVIDPNNGCENTSSDMVVEVHVPQTPTITWSGPLEFCHGETVVLDAGDGFSSYLWTSGSTEQTITVTESGEYAVTVIDMNNCLDSSLLADPIQVEVWNPQPLAYQQGDSVLVTNGPFAQYQWFLNGEPVPGATSAIHHPTVSGNYTCQVWDENDCSATSVNIEFTFTGIEEAFFGGRFDLYPNPSSGLFTLTISTNGQLNLDLSIHNILGKQVWSANMPSLGTSSRVIDLSDLPDGVYTLSLEAEGKQVVRKLVKQE